MASICLGLNELSNCYLCWNSATAVIGSENLLDEEKQSRGNEVENDENKHISETTEEDKTAAKGNEKEITPVELGSADRGDGTSDGTMNDDGKIMKEEDANLRLSKREHDTDGSVNKEDASLTSSKPEQGSYETMNKEDASFTSSKLEHDADETVGKENDALTTSRLENDGDDNADEIGHKEDASLTSFKSGHDADTMSKEDAAFMTSKPEHDGGNDDDDETMRKEGASLTSSKLEYDADDIVSKEDAAFLTSQPEYGGDAAAERVSKEDGSLTSSKLEYDYDGTVGKEDTFSTASKPVHDGDNDAGETMSKEDAFRTSSKSEHSGDEAVNREDNVHDSLEADDQEGRDGHITPGDPQYKDEDDTKGQRVVEPEVIAEMSAAPEASEPAELKSEPIETVEGRASPAENEQLSLDTAYETEDPDHGSKEMTGLRPLQSSSEETMDSKQRGAELDATVEYDDVDRNDSQLDEEKDSESAEFAAKVDSKDPESSSDGTGSYSQFRLDSDEILKNKHESDLDEADEYRESSRSKEAADFENMLTKSEEIYRSGNFEAIPEETSESKETDPGFDEAGDSEEAEKGSESGQMVKEAGESQNNKRECGEGETQDSEFMERTGDESHRKQKWKETFELVKGTKSGFKEINGAEDRDKLSEPLPVSEDMAESSTAEEPQPGDGEENPEVGVVKDEENMKSPKIEDRESVEKASVGSLPGVESLTPSQHDQLRYEEDPGGVGDDIGEAGTRLARPGSRESGERTVESEQEAWLLGNGDIAVKEQGDASQGRLLHKHLMLRRLRLTRSENTLIYPQECGASWLDNNDSIYLTHAGWPGFISNQLY